MKRLELVCMCCGDESCSPCKKCGRLVCYDCAKNSNDDEPICKECKEIEEGRDTMNTINLKERIYIKDGIYEEIAIRIHKDTGKYFLGIITGTDGKNNKALYSYDRGNLTDDEIRDIEAKVRAITTSYRNGLIQHHRVNVDPATCCFFKAGPKCFFDHNHSKNELVQSQKVDVDPLAGSGSEDYCLSLLGEVSDVTAEDIGNAPVLFEEPTNIDYSKIGDRSA